MNNTCISHLRISDADQIQIVVSKVGSGGGKFGGTDITIQAVNNNKEKRSSRSRKLPPLVLGEYAEKRLLSPRRVPSPSPSKCSEKSFMSGGGIPSPQPLSPSSASASGSRFHDNCFRPTSPGVPSLPLIKGSSIPVLQQQSFSSPQSQQSRSPTSGSSTSSIFRTRKEEKKEKEEGNVPDEIPDWKIEQYLLNNPDFVDAHVKKYWSKYKFTQKDSLDRLDRQKSLNEFLLSMVRSIFQDMVSMDTVIKKVMNFAQKLVDADRASLFLIDSKSGELYSRLFDMGERRGSAGALTAEGETAIQLNREIRFKIGTGIAGKVAETGETLNIPDAYSDPRFNREVDKETGYVTKSILCMPIFIRGAVMGVVQMVNKNMGIFDDDDVDAFATFAVYCGLALHHAKLYDKIRRSEQKFKVAVDVLSYHNSCSEVELRLMREAEQSAEPPMGISEFSFVTKSINDMEKVRSAVYMFIDLFGLSRFDLDSLYKFVLTVKKNYRRVPYHNWGHGFTVAHSMYCILKKSKVFKPLECLSLYVGSLCHDLDHRGKNNKFMLDTSSPLASIYTTSTLEHHHFNQTVTILQQDGLNIFSKLSSEEYKQVLGNIKHCILATDLALYFPNKAKLSRLLDTNEFNWKIPDHRLAAQAISITAADLCASAKPWEVQVETVKVIFEEFYDQGDIEKSQGRKPIPMMDRDFAHQLPSSQVGFLSAICISCYQVLHQLIPETLPLLEGCQKNLVKWKEVAEESKKNEELKQEKEEAQKEAEKQRDEAKKEEAQKEAEKQRDEAKKEEAQKEAEKQRDEEKDEDEEETKDEDGKEEKEEKKD